MLASLESNRLANEINNDLFAGMERVEESMDVADMNLLLKQHREALIFRDNKKAFMDSYKKGRTGVITSDELLFMDLMDRAYIREKNLVKEYKQCYNLYIDGDIGVVVNDLLIERLCEVEIVSNNL